ncbi:hypothetical protein BJV82DRAFT_669156 [Fennellomyces sp. T-0311]|nr:hypothetical protein BJV82DRAFT_669156 [Fennellomyces sp. T-0311]
MDTPLQQVADDQSASEGKTVTVFSGKAVSVEAFDLVEQEATSLRGTMYIYILKTFKAIPSDLDRVRKSHLAVMLSGIVNKVDRSTPPMLDECFREVVARDLGIVCGETACDSSKFDSQVNEHEHGSTTKHVSGRKVDLIFYTKIDKVKYELFFAEFKPDGISEDTKTVQENKNLRLNKSILSTLVLTSGLPFRAKPHYMHPSKYLEFSKQYKAGMTVSTISQLCTTSRYATKWLDFPVLHRGVLSEHGFSLMKHQDVVVAVKLSSSTLYVPRDEDDMEDFLQEGKPFEVLFNLKDHVTAALANLKKNIRKQEREPGNMNTVSLPPTFYTPKLKNSI